jgi:hypothetical protein
MHQRMGESRPLTGGHGAVGRRPAGWWVRHSNESQLAGRWARHSRERREADRWGPEEFYFPFFINTEMDSGPRKNSYRLQKKTEKIPGGSL